MTNKDKYDSKTGRFKTVSFIPWAKSKGFRTFDNFEILTKILTYIIPVNISINGYWNDNFLWQYLHLPPSIINENIGIKSRGDSEWLQKSHLLLPFQGFFSRGSLSINTFKNEPINSPIIKINPIIKMIIILDYHKLHKKTVNNPNREVSS